MPSPASRPAPPSSGAASASAGAGVTNPLIPPPLPASAPARDRSVRAVVRLVQGLRVHNAGDAAPAMAFHFFLSLIPLLVLVGFVVGQFARHRGVDALLGPAIETAPDAVEQLVREELVRMAGANASSIAPLSVLGFLWIAATGTHGLMDAFEVAAGAPRRPWWKKRVISIVWVAGTLVALAFVAWGLIGADAAIQRVSGAPTASASASATPPPSATPRAPTRHDRATPSSAGTATAKSDRDPGDTSIVRHARHRLAPLFQEWWERLAILSVFALAAVTALAGFYRFAVEHPPGVERRAWPGAIVALAAWLVVSWGFGAYVTSLGRYALFYGSVATVAVLLVWFYLTSWALLVGAELNAQLEGLRDRPRRPRPRAST